MQNLDSPLFVLDTVLFQLWTLLHERTHMRSRAHTHTHPRARTHPHAAIQPAAPTAASKQMSEQVPTPLPSCQNHPRSWRPRCQPSQGAASPHNTTQGPSLPTL